MACLEPAHLPRILRQYETITISTSPHRSLHGAAPMKPLPNRPTSTSIASEDTRVGGLINEYRLVA